MGLFSISRFANLEIENNARGFATNVANYQPLGESICPTPGTCKGGNSNHPCCADDPCNLQNDWNWAHNELNYVDVLDDKMRQAMPGFHPKFIIDTGRNGRPNARSNCGNWCNARGSGIGHVPTLDTPDPRIDAYFWLKTPGESDGCTQTLPDGNRCPRFDRMCASPDSIGSRPGEPRAPEAGLWFHYQIAELAGNAAMGDTSPFSHSGQCGVVIGTTTPSPPSPTSAPTPAPTPTPTLTPTPSPTPRPCKAWCLTDSRPWSTKCTWNNCAGCSSCQTLTPAPTPAPTLAPTPSPTPGLCKPWCSTNSKPWSTKCKWDQCAGCSECQVTSGQCKAFCATSTKTWSKKCLWEKCSGCPDCTSGARRLRGSKGSDEPLSNEELLV